METKNIWHKKGPQLFSVLDSLFREGDFTSDDNDLFTHIEINQLINNLLSGIPLPRFGAVQKGNSVVFKSGKVKQLIDAIVNVCEGEELSPLKKRKLYTFTHIDIDVIPLDDFYNPGLTQEAVDYALMFHL